MVLAIPGQNLIHKPVTWLPSISLRFHPSKRVGFLVMVKKHKWFVGVTNAIGEIIILLFRLPPSPPQDISCLLRGCCTSAKLPHCGFSTDPITFKESIGIFVFDTFFCQSSNGCWCRVKLGSFGWWFAKSDWNLDKTERLRKLPS
jgi:hypothetical protein